VVTGQCSAALVITVNDTSDVNFAVSLSTNKGFEWIDVDGNGKYDPLNGGQVLDMGVRGMILFKKAARAYRVAFSVTAILCPKFTGFCYPVIHPAGL
jgi:hypothetical protein